MDLSALKREEQSKVNQLINECKIFFAFSDEQFHKNKTPLQTGEKYVALGAGAYMPKGQVERYRSGIKAINKWYKDSVNGKKLRKANIVHAIHNHEAHYTGEIDEVMDALGSDYTKEEVMAIFREM